jgi:hypothetical protein
MQNWDSDWPFGMKLASLTLNKSWLRARLLVVIAAAALAAAQNAAPAPAPAQSSPAASDTYKPKFPGDPARSNSEAAALGYMRTVLRAQREFNKKNDHFATSLAGLVHTGSFTKRMVNSDRGDYTVGFQGKKDSFALTMTPKQLDAQHRSFYAEDDGKIHADEEKPADAKSPVVK